MFFMSEKKIPSCSNSILHIHTMRAREREIEGEKKHFAKNAAFINSIYVNFLICF